MVGSGARAPLSKSRGLRAHDRSRLGALQEPVAGPLAQGAGVAGCSSVNQFHDGCGTNCQDVGERARRALPRLQVPRACRAVPSGLLDWRTARGDYRMTYLKDVWYCAALSSEIADRPLGRIICE